MENQNQNQDLPQVVLPLPLSLLDIRNNLKDIIAFSNERSNSTVESYIPKFWNTVAILLNATNSNQVLQINGVNYLANEYKPSDKSELANALSVGRIYLFENVKAFVDDKEILKRITVPLFDNLTVENILTPAQFTHIYEYYARVLNRSYNPVPIVKQDFALHNVSGFFVSPDYFALTGTQTPGVSIMSARVLGLHNYGLQDYVIDTAIKPSEQDAIRFLFGGE